MELDVQGICQSCGRATRILGVSERTLRRWEEEGKIETIRSFCGQRRYNVTGFATKSTGTSCFILYALHVPKQKEDLLRQCEYLQSRYPNAELIKEIVGGLNYKRKQLLAILERVMSGDVECIVVAYQDRLCRFGFDIFEWFCIKHSCEIMVLNQIKLSPQQELVDDILAILHCFSARLYGLRKYKSEIKQDSSLSRNPTPSDMETVVSSE